MTNQTSIDHYNATEKPTHKLDIETIEEITDNVALILVTVLSLTANILIIFSILKFKKMRYVTNMIFLQVNILQGASMFVMAVIYKSMTILGWDIIDAFYRKGLCANITIELSLIVTTFWFLYLLLWNWYLKIYMKETYVKFCRAYKWFIASVYILGIFVFSLTVQFCFVDRWFALTYLIVAASIVFILLFLIIINIVHVIRRRKATFDRKKGNIGLAIANICFLIWSLLPIFIATTLVLSHQNYIVINCLIPLLFSSPVFNLIYLFCCDDEYNIFLKKMFTCRCNDYTNETLEQEAVRYNEASGVLIPEN